MPRPRVSILMYHALVEKHEPYMAPVHVEVQQFTEQMAWLAASGLRVMPLHEVPAALRQSNFSAQPAVALTFDDGYRSLFVHARPILQRYGFAATLFLTTAAVGQPSYASEPGFVDSAPRGDRPLQWAELHALVAAGWRVESHGCTHRPPTELTTGQLMAELRQSRAAIARHLGSPASFYAFPYGRYDRRTLKALAPAGYQAGFSVHGGPAEASSDLRRLPRIEITAACDLETFQQKVATGYASGSAQQRAWVRNLAYKVPIVKDLIHRLLPSTNT